MGKRRMNRQHPRNIPERAPFARSPILWEAKTMVRPQPKTEAFLALSGDKQENSINRSIEKERKARRKKEAEERFREEREPTRNREREEGNRRIRNLNSFCEAGLEHATATTGQVTLGAKESCSEG